MPTDLRGGTASTVQLGKAQTTCFPGPVVKSLEQDAGQGHLGSVQSQPTGQINATEKAGL